MIRAISWEESLHYHLGLWSCLALGRIPSKFGLDLFVCVCVLEQVGGGGGGESARVARRCPLKMVFTGVWSVGGGARVFRGDCGHVLVAKSIFAAWTVTGCEGGAGSARVAGCDDGLAVPDVTEHVGQLRGNYWS